MENIDKKRKSILIVDDDERFLSTTKELLEAEGYLVFTFAGVIGITTFVKSLKPDLVLLDINMPALSGDNVAKLLRQNIQVNGAPIVFHSSNDEDSLRKAVAECGVKGYICKGDTFELKRKVARYLEAQAMHRQREMI